MTLRWSAPLARTTIERVVVVARRRPNSLLAMTFIIYSMTFDLSVFLRVSFCCLPVRYRVQAQWQAEVTLLARSLRSAQWSRSSCSMAVAAPSSRRGC